jgi:hypothetical protein
MRKGVFAQSDGYVYETFGISKHFPVKLQLLLIRAVPLAKPLTAKCFIYDVVCCYLSSSCTFNIFLHKSSISEIIGGIFALSSFEIADN